MAQAADEQVLRQIVQLAGAQLCAQELAGGLGQLMGLVKNHHTRVGQQLRHARFAHGLVGKEQVVVDHQHIGRQGRASRLVHMAVGKAWAVLAQTVVAR